MLRRQVRNSPIWTWPTHPGFLRHTMNDNSIPSENLSSKTAGNSAVIMNPINNSAHSVAPQFNAANANGAHPSASSSELLSAFECPVCLDCMLPPYLQCPSGHLVCGSCRPKVTCCPSCRGPVPSIRNLAMERIASTLIFPCRYNGCTQSFAAQEKVEHEEVCEHRPYSCPCPGAACKWQGALPEVMTHLVRNHKSITTLQGEDIVFLATDINLPGAVDWVMMQNCFGYYFMLVLEKQDKAELQTSTANTQMFYAVVQLIGAKNDAESFMYRLELNNRRRRLTFEGTPRSIHEGVSGSINQSDCLCFDTNQAQLFSENGNLGINVTITRLSDAADDGSSVSSGRVCKVDK
uniref:E3 ubiquitin-protein ligase n=1 Tax=Panagrellus redivivus TaxID=6233 RepID=A0A7E4VRA0_PANRE